ncbi:hypothetical protein RRF57_007570 [Xylaria bambusicola]|uniref:Uncharacterized protein n=1 Tax=Xylaria bambusicola TaxID=326684 RepID=A0AAN7UTX7_9PEZI
MTDVKMADIVGDEPRATPSDYASDPEHPASSCAEVTQEGVKAMEAISMTWSKWGLIAAYFGIFLMAFTTSLEGQVTYNLTAFATSSFSSHSLIATVYVIQGVVNGMSESKRAEEERLTL